MRKSREPVRMRSYLRLDVNSYVYLLFREAPQIRSLHQNQIVSSCLSNTHHVWLPVRDKEDFRWVDCLLVADISFAC
jgi:hypothetical protein